MNVNGAQWHLWLNHFPVILPLVALSILGVGLLKRSRDLRLAALGLFVAAALLAIPAYLTGDPAEAVAKNYPGTIRAAIHEHELAAQFALASAEITGVFALVLLVLLLRGRRIPRAAWGGLVVVSLWAFSVVARTAHLGGLIRHEEIRPPELSAPK